MGSVFALVLHTHLPMVVNHGRWPHGSDWLCEAAFECYLPLLETAHRLVADGISPKWTVNLSPVLTEQLAAPVFRPGGEGARQVILGGAPSHTDRHHEIADSRTYPQGPLP